MRITNKIIQNNSLNNINTNKTLQDSLSTMLSTEKKIARPSDDPIIALRSLRLRTSVNQTSQYVEKNVEDAKSWLDVTEDAIDTLSDIITDMRKQYTKATSDTLTPSDRRIIAENLQSLAAEVYNTGNVDFAGRSVFTGYRTESTLTFQKQEDISYNITETNDTAKIDSLIYVSTGASEQDVNKNEITRIRLSYSNCSGPLTGLTMSVADASGNVTKSPYTTTQKSLNDDPYKYVIENPGEVVYVPETGEILIGENVCKKEDIQDFSAEYTKTQWQNGDLRPEHYFDCKDNTNGIEYDSHDGEIVYNIGTNQTLRINTTASECFSHDIARDVEDVINAINEVEDVENRITQIEAELSSYDAADTANIADAQERLDAAKKEKVFLDEKLHSMLSGCITNADEYLNANNIALTNCGTRSKRLELVENRLDTQLSTLKELKSQNEDVDLAETAVRLSSANTSYSAALLATSKILKESLLNYI